MEFNKFTHALKLIDCVDIAFAGFAIEVTPPEADSKL